VSRAKDNGTRAGGSSPKNRSAADPSQSGFFSPRKVWLSDLATTVAQLKAVLSADTRDFDRGMDRSHHPARPDLLKSPMTLAATGRERAL
jgi:hypothetical protein